MIQNSETPVQTMDTTTNLRAMAILLLIISLLIIGWRYHLYDRDQGVKDNQLWNVAVTLTFSAAKDGLKLSLSHPRESQHLRLIQRSIYHPGLRISHSAQVNPANTYTVSGKKPGDYQLSLEYLIYQQLTAMDLPLGIKAGINDKQTGTYHEYLKPMPPLDVDAAQIHAWAAKKDKHLQIPEQLIENLYEHLKKRPEHAQRPGHEPQQLFQNAAMSSLEKARFFTAAARAIGIPSRIVTGIVLQQDGIQQLHWWNEMYMHNTWRAYDAARGFRHKLPPNYLALKTDATDIVNMIKGKLQAVEIKIVEEFEHPYLDRAALGLQDMFDFRRLPENLRAELGLILLLPLGILLTVFFKHLAGIPSYGVFTPALLAMALLFNDMLTTAIIFSVTCLLAVTGRGFFPSKLSQGPRLAIIFTLIAIIISYSTAVIEQYYQSDDNSVILLPLIILTSLVDRFYRTQEESGLPTALRRLGWTVVIALLCIPLLNFKPLGQFFILYPEAHLISLALMLLIAGYQGKTLMEKLLAFPLIKK